MSLDTTIVSTLDAYTGLTAITGSRLYPGTLPQEPTLPAITYRRIDTPRVASLDGDDTLINPRYQFDVYAADTLTAGSVVGQLRAAMATISALAVDQQDDPSEANDLGRFRIIVDFKLWSNE